MLWQEQESSWLSAAPEQAESLLAVLAPLSENQMELYPVSRRVTGPGMMDRNLFNQPACFRRFRFAIVLKFLRGSSRARSAGCLKFALGRFAVL